MNKRWNDLAKSRMKEIGMTQDRLAELLGKTQGGIGHWLNGRRDPSIEDIAQIMGLLGMSDITLNSKGYISCSEEELPFSWAKPYNQAARHPVLSKVQAGSWSEAIEAYTTKDIDQWLESDASIQGEAFWLEVEGDSMTSPMGLSIPEGTFVLFDTGREAHSGSLVVAKLSDSNEATFKKLIIDGSRRYLKGLNPSWPMIEVNGNCKIIGVAIETKMRLI